MNLREARDHSLLNYTGHVYSFNLDRETLLKQVVEGIAPPE
jgi:hypothetical protein